MGTLLALAALCAGSGTAAAIAGDSRDAIGLDGSLRTITALALGSVESSAGSTTSAGGEAQMLLRLQLEGHPTTWLSYESHLLHATTVRGAPKGTRVSYASDPGLRYRTVDDRWRWHKGDHATVNLMIDRFNVKFSLPFVDISLGRQAISFGKTYFWNPADIFLSFAPTAFDKDYKAGVDALEIDIPLGDLSGITLVGVLGRPTPGHVYYRSAFVARLFTTAHDWDFSAQGGKIHGGYHLAAGASGEIRTLEARAELSYFWSADLPEKSTEDQIPSGFAMVVGMGRSFIILQRRLVIQGEYLFNNLAHGGTLSENLKLFSKGLLLHPGEHALGLLLSYQALPLLNATLAAITAISRYPSAILQPRINYSAADEVEVVAGALVSLGKRSRRDKSEKIHPASVFGSYPHLFYVEVKIYF